LYDFNWMISFFLVGSDYLAKEFKGDDCVFLQLQSQKMTKAYGFFALFWISILSTTAYTGHYTPVHYKLKFYFAAVISCFTYTKYIILKI